MPRRFSHSPLLRVIHGKWFATQYMGKANAMGGRANLILNIICYSVVFGMFSIDPTVALKVRVILSSPVKKKVRLVALKV